MAISDEKTAQRSVGFFSVNPTCIICDTCMRIAPHHFALAGDQATLIQAPRTNDEMKRCLMAQYACPVSAIRRQTQR